MVILDAMERSQMKQDQIMEELTVSMAGLSATMHHGFEHLEWMMVERHGGGMNGR